MKNLEALGAARLADLLIEITRGDAAAKRRLRLELTGASGPAEVAREIRKRLNTISRARSFVDWKKLKALVNDLETQQRAIIDHVADADPHEALDLMWRFMALANSVFDRCDDSSGAIIGIFHDACDNLGGIAEAAKPAQTTLADQAFRALTENDYGQYDNLIEALMPALGQAGLGHIKQCFIRLSEEPLPKPIAADREVIGSASSGPVYADQYAEGRWESVVRMALQEIADAQGDVDAFIAQQSVEAKAVPAVAAAIALRLLNAGRNLRALPAIVERPVVGWAAVGTYDTFDIQQMLKSVDHRRLEIQPILDKETYKYVHVD